MVHNYLNIFFYNCNFAIFGKVIFVIYCFSLDKLHNWSFVHWYCPLVILLYTCCLTAVLLPYNLAGSRTSCCLRHLIIIFIGKVALLPHFLTVYLMLHFINLGKLFLFFLKIESQGTLAKCLWGWIICQNKSLHI